MDKTYTASLSISSLGRLGEGWIASSGSLDFSVDVYCTRYRRTTGVLYRDPIQLASITGVDSSSCPGCLALRYESFFCTPSHPHGAER